MENRETRVFKWDDRIYEDAAFRSEADPLIDERSDLIKSIIEMLDLPLRGDLEILDLGCGSGYMSYQIRQFLPKSKNTGVDLSENSGRVYRDHDLGEFVEADVTSSSLSAELRGKRFDLIVSAEVIEHLVFPVDLIRNIDVLLKEGGHCILTTPFHGLLKNFMILLCGKFDSHFNVEWDHIRFFSVKSLVNLIRKNSRLEVVKVIKYGRIFPVYRGMIVVLKKKGG